MEGVRFLTLEELETGLEEIRRSPPNEGTLRMIVRRPRTDEREVLKEGELDVARGLIGDNWLARGSSRTADGSAHPGMQINVMNARVIALLAQQQERWQLAGDQLYVDLDLSEANLPPGTRLSIGSAVIEVSPEPHTGCKKFVSRFGPDAVKFVNAPERRHLHLRGINAKVVESGRIRAGDRVSKA
jgi:hypothetical protein